MFLISPQIDLEMDKMHRENLKPPFFVPYFEPRTSLLNLRERHTSRPEERKEESLRVRPCHMVQGGRCGLVSRQLRNALCGNRFQQTVRWVR